MGLTNWLPLDKIGQGLESLLVVQFISGIKENQNFLSAITTKIFLLFKLLKVILWCPLKIFVHYARMSSYSDQVRPLRSWLPLKAEKNSHRLIKEKMFEDSAFTYDWILVQLEGITRQHKILAFSCNLGQSGLVTSELLALECQETCRYQTILFGLSAEKHSIF